MTKGKPFGTVVIVGVGLIGGSLGMCLRRSGLAETVVGIEPDSTRGEAAVVFGAIDHAQTHWAENIDQADLVVLSAPVGHILTIVGDVLARVKAGTVVTDVGSTKGAIVHKAGKAPFFVGGHPMTGSEKVGVEAARTDLFTGATWALTPTERTDTRAFSLVKKLVQITGAQTLMLTAKDHDAMTAVTSHLPHVLASSLMCLATEKRRAYPDIARLSAGSFADSTRVAASSPEIWRDVCLSNRDAILEALHGFRGQLDLLEAALMAGSSTDLKEFFAQGRTAKETWKPD